MDLDYFIVDLMLIEELEDLEMLEDQPALRRVKFYKHRMNPLEELDEIDFRKKYRFSKSTAVFIINLVKDDLAVDTRGGGIAPYLQVLTAIRTWGRGEIQDDAGDLSGMSQPMVSLICKKVALAIVSKRHQFIKMPRTEQQQNRVISEFHAINGFRSVIGAIDCTHIRIPSVGPPYGYYYINRKNYPSLNVQVVCSARLLIMDIVAHWRGNTHDSRIFSESRIRARFENDEFKGRLLGDSGYACTPYLFTPVLNPRTRKEELYNQSQIKTRNTVERCFGVWKQRYRCLLRGFTTSLENIKLYIIALAVLHNIAILHQDFLEEENIEDVEVLVPVANVINNNLRGNAVRAAFIEENF